MYCPSCGKPIPDGSRFCMNCGTPIKGDVKKPQELLPSGNPPEFIKEVITGSFGPSVKKGLLRTVYRGFRIGIVLADSSGKETAWDGVLAIQIKCGGDRFEDQLSVRKEDFEVVTAHYLFGQDQNHIAYTYKHLDPIFRQGCSGKVEVRLTPSGGKTLYYEQNITSL